MPTYRLVYIDENGEICHRDLRDKGDLLASYEQIGVEEDSYTMRLHGEPTFKGLIGPLSEGKSIVRYETPEAFVRLTEVWASDRRNGRPKRGGK